MPLMPKRVKYRKSQRGSRKGNASRNITIDFGAYALQIERRISFRRAMKKSIQTSMEFGAEGIKLRCAGRLGGADISRAEWYREGKIPLHTLRTPIDYGFAEANTVYGKIGVKCWMCKKVDPNEQQPEKKPESAPEETAV